MAKIILLCGPSASGKSFLAQAFVAKMRKKGTPWLFLDNDEAFRPEVRAPLSAAVCAALEAAGVDSKPWKLEGGSFRDAVNGPMRLGLFQLARSFLDQGQDLVVTSPSEYLSKPVPGRSDGLVHMDLLRQILGPHSILLCYVLIDLPDPAAVAAQRLRQKGSSQQQLHEDKEGEWYRKRLDLSRQSVSALQTPVLSTVDDNGADIPVEELCTKLEAIAHEHFSGV